ncbi:50S ribosomal protein L11 methyltransferase [Campylobacter sp. MIT 12-8780]|uniref:50S ribosomal protein L11 methyltransferase n=1 Tax=unclassified Campylobacter TaxID=2593542 RepID=UPI0010F8446C|nr:MULTISPECIES: 50S ribosomal protein L11 methyltransferase [unclassified Campylobacter]TKX30358.1 50S ribosomal protein L11 methyltransferase [Campylobacter sp. MIT 12-5580]TQR41031.1 50S ribosomal protein L11 methyltransferase [Campylobacter sp. MIT 12-8780]
MQNHYNEFFFKVDEVYKNIFTDFIFELGIDALEEKDGGFYIRSDEDLSDIIDAIFLLKSKLEQQKNTTINLESKFEQKENKNWIEEYKKSVAAIQIDNFYIHSSWQESKKGLINIQIDPALAFGSGHHESTHSCIQLLQQYAKKDMKVLDVGCGSGILSIILAKLGCKVEACDTDEIAVESSLNNAKLNQVGFQRIWQGSLSDTKEKYDLIVANLVADIILSLAKNLQESLKINAYLILSGILDKHEERIKQAFVNLKPITSLKNNEWLSLVYQKER